MSEANKQVVQQICDVFTKGNVEALDNFVSDQMVDHNPSPGQAPGVQGMKDLVTMFRAAFPDLQVTVEDLIAEGDKVVGRITAKGTHKGEFMGTPATNKQISIQEIDIARIAGGKIVEHWGLEDSLGLMQQLGMIPE